MEPWQIVRSMRCGWRSHTLGTASPCGGSQKAEARTKCSSSVASHRHPLLLGSFSFCLPLLLWVMVNEWCDVRVSLRSVSTGSVVMAKGHGVRRALFQPPSRCHLWNWTSLNPALVRSIQSQSAYSDGLPLSRPTEGFRRIFTAQLAPKANDDSKNTDALSPAARSLIPATTHLFFSLFAIQNRAPIQFGQWTPHPGLLSRRSSQDPGHRPLRHRAELP